jgi:sulfur-carrier protein
MNVTLKFFASVREAVGTSTEVLELPEGGQTVAGIRALLVARGGAWAQALGEGRALRMACNQVMCQPETVVQAGAEVAFFPPVTGG